VRHFSFSRLIGAEFIALLSSLQAVAAGCYPPFSLTFRRQFSPPAVSFSPHIGEPEFSILVYQP
jgi:hypothetical protein